MNLSRECQEFEALLEQRLDERLDPRTVELQAHAEQCVVCRERLRQATLVLHAVSAWRKTLPGPSESLIPRVLASLPRSSDRTTTLPQVKVRALPPDQAPGKWQMVAVAAASIAAMWLIFLGTAFQDNRHPGRNLASVGPWTPPTVTPVPVPASIAPQPDFETVLVSAEGAYSQLATETLEVAQDFALLWPSSQAVSDNSTSPQPTPQIPATDSTSDWADDLAPISDSVGDALNFLWRAAPSVEKTAT